MKVTQDALSRGEMLKLGLLAGAALILPFERRARTVTIADRIPESQLPLPFLMPFVVPPTLKPVKRTKAADIYKVTQKAAEVQILPEEFGKTLIYGYNGITPGPTIKVDQGRKTVVRMINRLPGRHPYLGYESTSSCHLHGSASLPQYDGYASDITRPQEFKDYHYPNFQPARTLWYHDHGVHHTAENAYMGLAAQYHIHDKRELSLPIPHGRYDVPFVLQDKLFAQNGKFIFEDQDHSTLMGDAILVNGVPWPVMKVERRKYRFRMLNASVSRSYRLALDSGEDMIIIGHDGGLAPQAAKVKEFRFIMAERYEVVIDFSKHKVGDRVRLLNLSNENNQDFPSTEQVMEFRVVSNPTSTKGNANPMNFPLSGNNEVMQRGTPADLTRDADATLEVVRRQGLWTINGETWVDVENSDFKRVVANPALDEVQVWDLQNNSGGWHHPLHIHLIDFKILGRIEGGDRIVPPLPHERGPKDVTYLGEGETVRVIAKYGPHKGRYMVHCHNLVHEDHDMMVQFKVGNADNDNDPNHPIEADPAKPISRMRPL